MDPKSLSPSLITRDLGNDFRMSKTSRIKNKWQRVECKTMPLPEFEQLKQCTGFSPLQHYLCTYCINTGETSPSNCYIAAWIVAFIYSLRRTSRMTDVCIIKGH